MNDTQTQLLDDIKIFLKDTLHCSCLAIRFDKKLSSKSDEIQQKMVQLIMGNEMNDRGISRKWDDQHLLCILSNIKKSLVKNIAEQIKTDFQNQNSQTVSIGIAHYPMLNFAQIDIVNNAFKALEHADFFGPNSLVEFDAVSLNISADQKYQAHDLQGAIKEYILALKLDPSNINVHNSLGVCYGMEKFYQKALDNFETVIWMNPDDVMATYNIGVINLLQKDFQNALKYFLKAETNDPNIFEIQLQIGKFYLDMNDYENAKKYLEYAVKLNSDAPDAHRILGDCYLKLNFSNKAIDAYKKTIKLNPNDAFALSSLGFLFKENGKDIEIAKVFLEQSVEINPNNGLFHYRLAKLYFKQNQLENALIEFQHAQQLGEGKAIPYIEKVQAQILKKAS